MLDSRDICHTFKNNYSCSCLFLYTGMHAHAGISDGCYHTWLWRQMPFLYHRQMPELELKCRSKWDTQSDKCCRLESRGIWECLQTLFGTYVAFKKQSQSKPSFDNIMCAMKSGVEEWQSLHVEEVALKPKVKDDFLLTDIMLRAHVACYIRYITSPNSLCFWTELNCDQLTWLWREACTVVAKRQFLKRPLEPGYRTSKSP